MTKVSLFASITTRRKGPRPGSTSGGSRSNAGAAAIYEEVLNVLSEFKKVNTTMFPVDVFRYRGIPALILARQGSFQRCHGPALPRAVNGFAHCDKFAHL